MADPVGNNCARVLVSVVAAGSGVEPQADEMFAEPEPTGVEMRRLKLISLLLKQLEALTSGASSGSENIMSTHCLNVNASFLNSYKNNL